MSKISFLIIANKTSLVNKLKKNPLNLIIFLSFYKIRVFISNFNPNLINHVEKYIVLSLPEIILLEKTAFLIGRQ
jgi:hypothetical protein